MSARACSTCRHGAVVVSRYPYVSGPSWLTPGPTGPDRRVLWPGSRPRPTGRDAAHTLPVRAARLPTRGGVRWLAPWCRRAHKGAQGPGGPARKRPPPRGMRRGRRPWHRPAGSRSRLCPTPHPAQRGGPGGPRTRSTAQQRPYFKSSPHLAYGLAGYPRCVV